MLESRETMQDNAAMKNARQRRTGALVLNSTQVGLVLGFVVVGVITAFGVGFIVGMWYQASEHITPYEDRPAPTAEEQSESPSMTFYSTLTTRDAGSASPAVSSPPATRPAPGAQEVATRVPTRAGTPSPAAKAGERPAALGGELPPASSRLPSAPAAAKRDAGAPLPVVSSLQVIKPAPGAPEAANRPPARAVTPSTPKTGEYTPTPGGAPLQPEKVQTAVVQPPPRPSGTGYSVQVGSFRAQEQAEQLRSRLAQKGYPVRVQASVLSDKGTWYRVRVGHFPDRTLADQAAQRLMVQERLSVIVAEEAK